MEAKNPKNFEKKAVTVGKISLQPDEEISGKINEILKILREKEITVSSEKILKFVLRGVNAASVARKMISNKKTHDEIIKRARHKAAALWN